MKLEVAWMGAKVHAPGAFMLVCTRPSYTRHAHRHASTYEHAHTNILWLSENEGEGEGEGESEDEKEITRLSHFLVLHVLLFHAKHDH